MYISPISNSHNINLKAKLSLCSERNLLPKGAVQKLVEKAKTIRQPEDKICVALNKEK